jgi:hypothetical protein
MLLSPHKPLEHRILRFSDSIRRVFERKGKTLYAYNLTTLGKRVVDFMSPILFRELLKTYPDLKYKQYYEFYNDKTSLELEQIIKSRLSKTEINELRLELFRLLMYIKSVMSRAREYKTTNNIPSDVVANSLIQVYTHLEGLWDLLE